MTIRELDAECTMGRFFRQVLWGISVEAGVGVWEKFEVNSVFDWEPVKVLKEECCMHRLLRSCYPACAHQHFGNAVGA